MTTPLFKDIFGSSWDQLPPVMKKHYANRPFHDDTTRATGHMNIKTSRLIKIMSPLLKAFGALVPIDGNNIPVTVDFITNRNDNNFSLSRTFSFPHETYRFFSTMQPIGGNELVELMRFGLGWRTACTWQDGKVILSHRGYVLKICGLFIPLPLGLLLGQGYAEEIPVDENSFDMLMEIKHPLWGCVYHYSGHFKMETAT